MKGKISHFIDLVYYLQSIVYYTFIPLLVFAWILSNGQRAVCVYSYYNMNPVTAFFPLSLFHSLSLFKGRVDVWEMKGRTAIFFKFVIQLFRLNICYLCMHIFFQIFLSNPTLHWLSFWRVWASIFACCNCWLFGQDVQAISLWTRY